MNLPHLVTSPKNIAPWNDPEVVWVCENHPTKEQDHRLFPRFWKRCGGAGMQKESGEKKEWCYNEPWVSVDGVLFDLEANALLHDEALELIRKYIVLHIENGLIPLTK